MVLHQERNLLDKNLDSQKKIIQQLHTVRAKIPFFDALKKIPKNIVATKLEGGGVRP